MCWKKISDWFLNKNSVVQEKDDNEPGNFIDRLNSAEQVHKDVMKPIQNFIICDQQQVPIEWDKVKLWTDKDGLTLPDNCFRKQDKRIPQMFVTHYDVCQTSHSTVDVLKQRGLSVHFCIDGDGTIYQLTDTKDICWHALGVNNVSVGVEICNPIYTKYNDSQAKLWGQRRLVIDHDKIHGNDIGPYLFYYQKQIDALEVLLKTVCSHYNIPLVLPLGNDGKVSQELSQEVIDCKFRGVVGHYHLNKEKTDPGSMILNMIKLAFEDKNSK